MPTFTAVLILLWHSLFAIPQRIPGPGGMVPGGGGGPAVVTYKQATHTVYNNGGASTFSFTPIANPSVICAAGGAVEAATTLTGVSDSANGAWTSVDAQHGGSFAAIALFCVKNTTTSTITITWTVSAPGGHASIIEVNGANSSFPGTIASHANGALTTGTAADINTSSANISGALNDGVLMFTYNYYGVTTWAAGATNPSGVTIPATGVSNNGTGSDNIAGAYSILTGTYSAAVGMNPGSGVSDFGTIVAVDIPHA